MRRLALCLLLVALSPVAAHTQFRDDSTGLVIAPPDWMYRQGEDLLAPPTLVSCWYAAETEDQPWLKLCAERLDELPRTDEKLTFTWQERTVDGARVRLRTKDGEVVLYSVLLPLYKGPVRLDVVSPVRGSEEAKALLDETLATVRDVGRWTVYADDGPSPTYDDRSDRRLARLLGKIGTGLIIAGVGMWIRQRRERKKLQAEGGQPA